MCRNTRKGEERGRCASSLSGWRGFGVLAHRRYEVVHELLLTEKLFQDLFLGEKRR
jgi:hypothetical protein